MSSSSALPSLGLQQSRVDVGCKLPVLLLSLILFECKLYTLNDANLA
ncbi:MAG: hypothetical protein V7L27_01755 [Nostoc sp.]